jgi:hypothetical protein
MTLRPEPPLVKIATASAPAETFSVTIRLTSLRAEEPPAAIFIALRAITRCASNPSNVPSATANQLPNICSRSHGGSSLYPRREKPPKLRVRQLSGFLNRVACCFSFSVDWLNIALQNTAPARC